CRRLYVPPAPMALIGLFLVFDHTATTELYTLSLHDALPILHRSRGARADRRAARRGHDRPEPAARRLPALARHPEPVFARKPARSEEHTSELQSREKLVWRLLLEKKKNLVRPGHNSEWSSSF